MKRVNKFELLPKEDQQFILKTCDEHSYDTALEILACPRTEGGLAFTASRSALCRFYTHHHPDHRVIEQLGQFADAVRVKGQMHLSAGYEALVTLVQTRLLEGLKQGKAVADLDRDFRTLERIQRCFLTEEKRREDNGEKVRIDYWNHLEKLAVSPEPDFIRKDTNPDLGAAEHDAEDFEEDSDLDLDMALAQHSVDKPRPRHIPLAEILNARRPRAKEAHLMEILRASHAKSPDFPHFPPDSISNSSGNAGGAGKAGVNDRTE